MLRSALITLFIGLFATSAGIAHAQGIDPVQFIVTPETPGPNQEVRIEAQGVGSFLGDATITWRKDGEVVLSGPGERVLTFTTGAVGSRTTVTVSINSPVQGQISREFVFNPSVVNLIWEADTYVPPFFKGKALYTAGSPLKVVAYPSVVVNGSQAANGSMSFQWSRNGSAVPSASGLGRNSFSFFGDQLQSSEQIAVEVLIGTTRVGRSEITITTFEPLVVLYNRDPLRGVVYEQAFPQSVSLAGREITVQAEPYYFSSPNKNSGQLSYEWELNGQQTTGPDAGRGILTLRQEGSGSGASTLGVTVQNNDADNLIQRASNAIQILFGGQTDTSSVFSGLGAAVATFGTLAQVSNNNAGQLPYQPLEPLPGLPSNFQYGDSANLPTLLSALFRILIIAGGIFAVLMLTVGGITYMVSEVPGVKLDALDRAKAALLGILIIGSAWLILNTINPDLLKFKFFINKVGPGAPAPSAIQNTSRPAEITSVSTQNSNQCNSFCTGKYTGQGGKVTSQWANARCTCTYTP